MRHTRFAAAFILLLMTPLAGHAANPVALTVNYQRDADTLSIAAHGAPLTRVLSEISHKAGIAVTMDPTLQRAVTAEYSKRPTVDALKSLLREFNCVFMFRDETGGDGKVRTRVSGIRILPQGQTNASLKSIDEIEKTDRKLQQASHQRPKDKEKDKAEREKARMERKFERLEAIKQTDPERYERMKERLRKRSEV